MSLLFPYLEIEKFVFKNRIVFFTQMLTGLQDLGWERALIVKLFL